MSKNNSFQRTLQRENALKEIFYTFFFLLASWPRLLLEVFIRKNFGERYFSSFQASLMFLILGYYPFWVQKYMFTGYGFWETIWHNASWYLFLTGFVFMCLRRRNEIKRLPSVFELKRFTRSRGIINPFFLNLKFNGETFEKRTIETLVEPASFFAIGLLLIVLDQRVGYLIVIASVLYSLSYFATYHQGDQMVMDTIDKMIINEDFAETFINEQDHSNGRGLDIPARRPPTILDRQIVADMILENEFIEVL